MNADHSFTAFFLAAILSGSVASSANQKQSPLPAFPGAEGYGANAVGGRGGDVYYVTNLNDDGAGSLRYGINSATNARTILFKVSGNIRLKSGLVIDKPHLTIAGQSAPGDGICLQDYPVVLNASDLIVRHIRSRLGTDARQEADAMSIVGGTNIMVDHCSASWSVDETLSPTATAQNLTVQWTYITESLNESIHAKGPHGYGSLIRPKIDAMYTFHHNLYAHHSSRNPRAGTYGKSVLRLDFRNNVIYNWGYKAGYNNYLEEGLLMNYVGNYLISGPSTTNSSSAFDSVATNTVIYQKGNMFDVNRNHRVDGKDTDWQMFTGAHKKSGAPQAAPAVNTDSARMAYERVLVSAGATPWRRDPVDTRVTATVRTQTGRIINTTDEVNGWPTLTSDKSLLDSDDDGMPDIWEESVGLDPNNDRDRNNLTASGYTQLEQYLQWLSEPHAFGRRNTPLDVDLRGLTGNSGTDLKYTVTSANHDTALLADGHTVRFIPNEDFIGRASFAFQATDISTGVRIDPVIVGLLIYTSTQKEDPR